MKTLLLLIAAFAITTFAQNTTSGTGTQIRFFHGIAGGPTVDVYQNSVSQQNLLASNLAPGALSEYRNLTQSTENLPIIITQSGSTTNIIANSTAALQTNSKSSTIVITSQTNNTGSLAGLNATAANATGGANTTQTPITLVVLNDQLSGGQTASSNVALIRFVNVAVISGPNATNATGGAASASSLNLVLANGTVLFSNVGYLNRDANYAQIAPGNYNLQVVPANGGQPIASQQVTLAAGQAISLFAFVPTAGGAAILVRGTDNSAILFAPSTGGAATSGAVTSGSVTSGAVTSGAVTSGSVTSGVQSTGVVIITGLTPVTRPVSAAGSLRCDVATLGVVCAILFTIFVRRD